MIRAVLDTNLLVSYLLTHRPPIATLIDIFLTKGVFVMVTAPELLAEVDRVLTYPKLQRYYTDEERTRFVALVMALSEVVGLNVVGLRRAGFSAEDRILLKRTLRTLYTSGLPLRKSADELQARHPDGPARELADFVLESQRGVCGFAGS